jgi:hypothetical protein
MEGTFSMLADPTLPPPWKTLQDNKSGRIYYWNSETNSTQWSKPAPPVGSGPPRESKGKRRRRRRRAAMVPNEADQVNRGSGNLHVPASNGNHASADASLPKQELKVAATVPVPQEAQVSYSLYFGNLRSALAILMRLQVWCEVCHLDVRCVDSRLLTPRLLPWRATWPHQVLLHLHLV